MYDSYHEMEIVKGNTGNDYKNNNDTRLTATIVGNICESGTYLHVTEKLRLLMLAINWLYLMQGLTAMSCRRITIADSARPRYL